MSKERSVGGIDYSMTCPAICVHHGNKWSYDNCLFYYCTSKKKHIIEADNFFGNLILDPKKYTSQEERFNDLGKWAIGTLRILQRDDWYEPVVDHVYLEDYAFAAKGQVFNIGENTGLLKHKLWLEGFKFTPLSPPSIKKAATGKGNADKLKMYEAFVAETKFDLCKEFGFTPGQSPASDIVDSYFITKIGHEIESSKA